MMHNKTEERMTFIALRLTALLSEVKLYGYKTRRDRFQCVSRKFTPLTKYTL